MSISRRPLPSRSRGFTLTETAMAITVLAGLTAGLLMTVRFAQQMSLGKAAGEQMKTISDGATRYMNQYGKRILAIDHACAELTLTTDRSGETTAPSAVTPGTTAPPDCSLKDSQNNVLVRQAYQPTVAELVQLRLVRANDVPLLPHARDVTYELVTDDTGTSSKMAAQPRIFVSIRPTRDSTSGANGAGSTSGTTGTSGARSATPSPSMATLAATRAVAASAHPLDMPPTLYGVNCYDTHIDDPHFGNYIFYRGNDARRVMSVYGSDQIREAIAAGYPYFKDGPLSLPSN